MSTRIHEWRWGEQGQQGQRLAKCRANVKAAETVETDGLHVMSWQQSSGLRPSSVKFGSKALHFARLWLQRIIHRIHARPPSSKHKTVLPALPWQSRSQSTRTARPPPSKPTCTSFRPADGHSKPAHAAEPGTRQPRPQIVSPPSVDAKKLCSIPFA